MRVLKKLYAILVDKPRPMNWLRPVLRAGFVILACIVIGKVIGRLIIWCLEKTWHLGEIILLKLFPGLSHDIKIFITVSVLMLLPILFGTWAVSHVNKIKSQKAEKDIY